MENTSNGVIYTTTSPSELEKNRTGIRTHAKVEHIHLTAISKMMVDLVAQVS